MGEVEFRGPLLDGATADVVVRDILRQAQQAIGDRGVELVKAVVESSAKQRTGYYESRIATERAIPDLLVRDGGVRYGPWLEGVSERNRSTGFKGFHQFQRATTALRQEAGAITQRVVTENLHRLE